MRYVIRLMTFVCIGLVALKIGPASAEKRVALVVGNASYGHHAGLPNVPNDAAAMAALFKAARFDAVEVKHNLGIAELRRALREFSRQAAGADVAVLFFAGHGIEVDRTNYLIPVDARLAADLDVEDETVSLDRVLQLLEPAKRLRLVILDACRENPFAAGMKRTAATRSVGRGLARIEPAISNTLIAYATKANAVAADGKGAHSPFTAALVKHLTAPGLDLRIALGHVRDEVLAATGNKQEPYFTGSLGGGTVSIAGPSPVAPPAPTPPPAASPSRAEVAQFCHAVAQNPSLAVVQSMLEAHRGTPMAPCIEARIDELKKLALAVPPAPKPETAVGVLNPSRAAVPLTAAEERALKPGDGFKECDACPEMVVVPAGRFTMGSGPAEIAALVKETKDEHYRSEGPQRQVTIARPFAVGKFEVTFAEWDACVAAGGCRHRPNDLGWGRGSRPLIDVSWDDVTLEYLPWLLRKSGKTYRLLTESEWEYASRAGTTTKYTFGNTIGKSQAQFSEGSWASAGKTVEVGAFKANAFGLHDMHGNVWERVQDCWNGSYNGAPSDGSAWTIGDCGRRVLRGGSWINYPRDLRSAYRIRISTGFRSNYLGFRVARTL